MARLQVSGVTLFSAWERGMAGEVTRRAPLKAYAMTTLFLMLSISLSNIALSYINYPTKVSKRRLSINHNITHFCPSLVQQLLSLSSGGFPLM